MKGNDALQNAYNKQKNQFDEAKASRISNRNKQIEDINKKIESLQATVNGLVQLNREEREFENFDYFRLKAEKQSHQQKEQKKVF